MVLLHGVALEGLPPAGVSEGLRAAPQGIQKRVGAELAEAKSSAALGRSVRVLNGILEPARGADDGQGAVAHRIQLVQPAWFVPGRDQEQV